MAINAYLTPATSAGPTARASRRALRLSVTGKDPSGSDLPVEVHNISETGLLIECEGLAVGDEVDIELPHAGTVTAKLIWASGKMFGGQFANPISPAALSAAQLQSAIAAPASATSNPADRGPSEAEATPSNFAANFKRLRIERGLSQADVAERLGVSGPSISGWESGRARPKEDRLADLAGILGVSVPQLLLDPQPDAMHKIIDDSRAQVARATGVALERVRIIVEF
jgi:transcriptional regulator with XRE-family HTH domain